MLGHTSQHSQTTASFRLLLDHTCQAKTHDTLGNILYSILGPTQASGLLLEVQLYLQAKAHDRLGSVSKSQHFGSNASFRLQLEVQLYLLDGLHTIHVMR